MRDEVVAIAIIERRVERAHQPAAANLLTEKIGVDEANALTAQRVLHRKHCGIEHQAALAIERAEAGLANELRPNMVPRQISDADVHDSMQKNYVAPLLLARECAARIKKRGNDGAIVLLSTMQAVAAFESSINYAAPKAALIQAARIMAKQWGGPGGVRVNVIAPGVNRAGMALKSIESGKYDFYINQKIIPRFGRPEDVARVARLLLEPDNYVTGQVITVDGGLTLRRDLG